ncbi:Histidine kinase-- DNA gyrase B-- and HSP90-like ATPase family protein [Striga hermonthica]|uniref:Histidine kinase-- DNA gyrase B-- and HSP90-like ATPase family protein n=1 Tax=Striga hermonthica TaxID=68872 RepID=A0A9N7RI45_STRHE|nr:Histidine kinase-- DNA gyrase B-- and HSP90-like ATPase family protein [Striga hermonthica]
MANHPKFHNVKAELLDPDITLRRYSDPAAVIELSSSDSDSSSSDDDNGGDYNAKKKRKKTAADVLPVGFLDPLPSEQAPSPLLLPPPPPSSPRGERLRLEFPSARAGTVSEPNSKQFWKAGDYEGAPPGDWDSSNAGMDHVRVHPKFLHSNATSHKWVLGAFAELLDNSLDEVCHGATYVNVDMVKSKKDGSKMLLIEDNGGGMDPEKIRHCMSLGYSAKSKQVNTIGQYGNGFKTSTMRLGADVIVFSRCSGKGGLRPTQSIGLLSYSFLKDTGKQDIVVPMLDYERQGQDWNRILRSSATGWDRNVETIVQWSPFSSEADLLRQFNHMQDQGTRIIIYNLWEDDQGLLELDFDTDPHDIQIRGVNRDEKSIDMAKKYPNSKHFLTYRHSLRSYAAILYLRIPPNFRIILRGEDVEHHNVVNDMMMSKEVTYRPQPGADGIPKDSNMMAVVTVGFVKDAKAHIDVQGFNVYHKNRLIKPFWRVWTPAGSDGRGVIGVLEANFVEPAHDKQGFERTTVLARLEAKLVQMQKNYWTSNCHKIGYAPRNKNVHERDISPDSNPQSPLKKKNIGSRDKTQSNFVDIGNNYNHSSGKGDVRSHRKQPSRVELSSSSEEDVCNNDRRDRTLRSKINGSSSKNMYGKEGLQKPSGLRSQTTRSSHSQQENGYNNNELSPSSSSQLAQLREENLKLRERLKRKEEEILGDLRLDLLKEKERTKTFEAELQEKTQKYEELKAEQESLIDIFSEERQRRDNEEENLRMKLKEATTTIQQLLDRIKLMDKSKFG